MNELIFEFESLNGNKCLVLQTSWGVKLGYVGVPTDHKYYGIQYDTEDMWDAPVHGGLSYSDKLPGFPDNLWFFGYDFAHAGDYIPGLTIHGKEVDVWHVVDECEKLSQFLNIKSHSYDTKEILKKFGLSDEEIDIITKKDVLN